MRAPHQACITKPCGARGETLRGSLPLELLDAHEQRRIAAQRRESLEQKREVAAFSQYLGGKFFEEPITVDEPGCSFGTDAGEARIAVRAIAHQREIIRNPFGPYAKLGAHARRIANAVTPAVHLHDALCADALRKILIRRPDRYLLNPGVACGQRRRRSE